MADLHTAEPRLRRLIDAVAGMYPSIPAWSYRGEISSPGELLEGLILTESAGDPKATRYEPHQDRASRRDVQDADVSDSDDGMLEDDRSYGLMQVMGYNVRRLCGIKAAVAMDFGFLFLPLTNMGFGMRILLGELTAVASAHPQADDSERVTRALCRYNGGPTGDSLVNGDFRLRAYVNKVATAAALARADRRRRGWEEA